MKDEAGVGLLEIKTVAIMGDDNICLVIQGVKAFNQRAVILSIPLKDLEIGESSSRNLFITEPLVSEAENIPARLNIN